MPQQFAGDRTRIGGIVELAVAHVPAIVAQPGRELAHGGKDQRDLLGMMLNIARLVCDLGHDDDIAVPVRIGQSRQIKRQLIAQNQDQPGHQGTS